MIHKKYERFVNTVYVRIHNQIYVRRFCYIYFYKNHFVTMKNTKYYHSFFHENISVKPQMLLYILPLYPIY